MKVAEIEEAEKDKMRNKCKKIIDHGITCFINRQLIYNFPEQIFTEAGVISIEHADFDGEYSACASPLHFVLLPCSPGGRRCLAL